jgi:hypothetical protein
MESTHVVISCTHVGRTHMVISCTHVDSTQPLHEQMKAAVGVSNRKGPLAKTLPKRTPPFSKP